MCRQCKLGWGSIPPPPSHTLLTPPTTPRLPSCGKARSQSDPSSWLLSSLNPLYYTHVQIKYFIITTMGQHCPYLCDSVTPTYHDTLFPRIKRANGVIVVICGLCNEDIAENKLEYHLDYCHFAAVVCIEGQFYVECQLCEFVTLKVKSFSQHLRGRHGYMLRQEWENLSVYKQSLSSVGRTSHRELKNVPQVLPFKDYKVDKFCDDQFVAEYQGNLYKVSGYSKQYNPIEYNIDRVKGDLLWRYWFIQARLGRELVWYHLLSQPTQKGIKACIFLFFKQ